MDSWIVFWAKYLPFRIITHDTIRLLDSLPPLPPHLSHELICALTLVKVCFLTHIRDRSTLYCSLQPARAKNRSILCPYRFTPAIGPHSLLMRQKPLSLCFFSPATKNYLPFTASFATNPSLLPPPGVRQRKSFLSR